MKTYLEQSLIITGLLIGFGALSIYAGTGTFRSASSGGSARPAPEVKVTEIQNTNSSKHTARAKKIKLALLLDTSNSMDGLIEQAKSQLWTIVNELAAAKCDTLKPEIEIALYEYGNDNLSAEKGYIRMVTPFTGELDKISEALFSLTTNGGEEYCGHVIQTAVRQLNWSDDDSDLQVIFIAGNEPFSQGNVHYIDACTEARKKNIIVNTIFCGSFNEGIKTSWKNGADATTGSYMSIEQNSKTVFLPSPYDDQINALNYKLNDTYIEYGKEGKIKKEVQTRQDANANSYGSASSVTRAISKTSHIYKNKSWDMVDASEEKEFDVSKIPSDQLPEPMKTMTNEEKIQYVEAKKNERERIKKEISELNSKREIYLEAQRKESGEDSNTLDKSMIQSIRKQAAKKDLTF